MGLVRLDRNQVDPQFFVYQYISPQFQDFLANNTVRGATVDRISLKEFPSFPIVLPPLPEQQRIVGILDEAFDGIATAKANAEKNLQNAHELFGAYLRSIFVENGAGWVTKNLEDTVEKSCSLSYGIVQPGDNFAEGLPIVRPTDLRAKLIGLSGLKRIDPALASSYKRTTLSGNEILICVRGSTGVVSVASDELAGSNVTRGIVPIRFDPSVVNQDFGYYLLISEGVQKQIKAATYGAALMQINIRDLRRLSFSVPPIGVQKVLLPKLDNISSEVELLKSIYERKSEYIVKLKQSLLRQAFSGQL